MLLEDIYEEWKASFNSLTFNLVDCPNPCHPGCVRQGHAGEPDAGLSGIGADGATTPGNSQAPGTAWLDDLERDALLRPPKGTSAPQGVG
jgi:hypothetical protein